MINIKYTKIFLFIFLLIFSFGVFSKAQAADDTATVNIVCDTGPIGYTKIANEDTVFSVPAGSKSIVFGCIDTFSNPPIETTTAQNINCNTAKFGNPFLGTPFPNASKACFVKDNSSTRVLTVTNNRTALPYVASSTFGAVSGGISCGSVCAKEYNYNAPVTISAPAVTGYSVSLTGGCSASAGVGLGANCNLIMSTDQKVDVVYTRSVNYDLTVNKIGTGRGTITGTSNPTQSNISCGTTCNTQTKSYSSGTMVILTATPDSTTNSSFTGWTGACNNLTGTCSVPMSEARSVTARFNLPGGAIPTLNNPVFSNVTCNTATLGATVLTLGNPASISARGVCYRGYGQASRTDNGLSTCVQGTGTTTGPYTVNVTGLSPSTSYSFIGYADHSFAPGVTSQAVFSTPACPISIPTIPTNFQVTASLCSNNWLNLSWTESPGATSYTIRRNGVVIPLVYTCTSGTCSGSDTNLTRGVSYSYTVSATNTTGSSALSTPKSATVSGMCRITFSKNTNDAGSTESVPTYKDITTFNGGNVGTLPSTLPTRPGFTFSSWNTSSIGTGPTFLATTPVTSSYTVFAKWISAIVGPTVTLTAFPNPTYTGSTVLTWVVAGSPSSCSAIPYSGPTIPPGWAGFKASSNGSHTQTVSGITAPTTYAIQCDSATSHITVNIPEPTPNPSKPDLKAEFKVTPPSSVKVGEYFYLPATISNISNTDTLSTFASAIQIKRPTDSDINPARFGLFQRRSLLKNSSFELNPVDAFMSDGIWQMRVYADLGGEIDEGGSSYKFNNYTDWFNIQVNPVTPPVTTDPVPWIDANPKEDLPYNGKTTLEWWVDSGTALCDLSSDSSSNIDGMGNNKNVTTSHSTLDVSGLKKTTKFTLTCGSLSAYVEVKVLPPVINFDES